MVATRLWYDARMFWRMTKSVLILPGSALIYIPIIIQWFSDGWPFDPLLGGASDRVFAAILAVPAFVLAVKTMALFVKQGEGTPAPWDPPRKFVVSGPYRHMRNPMLTSVVVMILAEAVALRSLALLGWALLFCLLNTAYFYLSEEPELERRFGDAYRDYKASVPRWIPKVRPYLAPKDY